VFFRESPNLVIRSLDRVVARRAALVRAESRLQLPDAIIVATALEEGCDAMVGNNASMAQRGMGIPYLYLGNYIS
jgi:predicted nucleic acid-binding protein